MKKHFANIVKVITFFVLWVISVLLGAILPFNQVAFLKGNDALFRLWLELLPLLGVLLVTWLFVFAVEKGNVTVRILKNPLKNTIEGFLLGIVWLAGAILPLYLFQFLTLGSQKEVPYLAVWLIAVLLNAAMQELLIRGYLFSLLKDRYNLIVAAVVTTIIFTAMHGGAWEAGAIAVFNVITMSVFVTLLLMDTESLLAPIIVHFVWNAIGHLVFGIVSLAKDYPSLWKGVLSGHPLMTGGTAKLEGSIAVSVVNVLLIAFMGYRIKNHRKEA